MMADVNFIFKDFCYEVRFLNVQGVSCSEEDGDVDGDGYLYSCLRSRLGPSVPYFFYQAASSRVKPTWALFMLFSSH